MIITAYYWHSLPELKAMPTLGVGITGELKIVEDTGLGSSKRVWLDTNPEDKRYDNLVITEYDRRDGKGFVISKQEYAVDPDIFDVDDWPYPGIVFWWRQGNTSWREINEETFLDQLNVVYPERNDFGCFAQGEPQNTGERGAIHAMFVKVHERYFCKLDWLVNYDPVAYRYDIIDQLDLGE